MARVGSPMSSRSQVGILLASLTFQTRLLLAPARDGAPKPNPHLGHCSFSTPFPSTLHPQEYMSPELSPTSELILG